MNAVKYKLKIFNDQVMAVVQVFYFLKGKKDNQNYSKRIELILNSELNDEEIAFQCHLSTTSLRAFKKDVYIFAKYISDNYDELIITIIKLL